MQFSDSDSSDSSVAPAPVLARRLQNALPQRLSGSGTNTSGGPASTVRAFTRTASQNSLAGRVLGHGEESDRDTDAHRGSLLLIHVTADTQGSPMTTATRARAFVPDSDQDSEDKDDGCATHDKAGVPTQKTPLFFAQTLSADGDATAATAGRSSLKGFQLFQSSSSSSASSLSLELPGVSRAAMPKSTGSAQPNPKGRLGAVHPISSSSSSSSSSPSSVVVFHRLPISHGTTAASSILPAVTHKDPTPLATVSVPASTRSLIETAVALPNAVSTFTEARRYNTAAETSALGGGTTRSTAESKVDSNAAAAAVIAAALDDVVGEDAKDTSAASLIAQATLGTADQQQQKQTSTVLHSKTDAVLSTAQQAPVQLYSFSEQGMEEVETMPSDAENATTESTQADLRQLLSDPTKAEGTVTGPRRQPPPPPVLATNTTTVTRPSHSVMRPDDDDAEHEDNSEEEDEHCLSKIDTESTIEQQSVPAMHATSIEAAQAAMVRSSTLLPPTRSSSSTSSRNGINAHDHKHPAAHKADVRLEKPMCLGPEHDSNISDSSDAETTLLSPTLNGMDRSGTLERNGGGKPWSIKRIGTGNVTTAPSTDGPSSTAVVTKHQPFLSIPSVHGNTLTTALAAPATTGDESLSHLNGVLMPPSPSQPRVGLSPHTTSPNSTNAGPLPPPTPPHFLGGKVAEDDDNGRHKSPVQNFVGVRHMAPAPASSSPSSASYRSNNGGLTVRGRAGDAPNVHRSNKSEEKVDGSGSVKAVVEHKTPIRTMPMMPSDDEDENNVGVGNRGMRGATEELVNRSSFHASTTSSSSEAASSTASAHVQRTIRAYKLEVHDTDHGAIEMASHAQNFAFNDSEIEEEAFREVNEDVEAPHMDWEDNSDGSARGDSESDSLLELQESGRWNEVLKGMELVDYTLVSQVYQQTIRRSGSRESDVNAGGSEGGGEDVCLFKVLSLFPVVASDERARWCRRTEVQRRLLDLAQDMRDTQRALDDAGLTAAGMERSASTSRSEDNAGKSRPTRTTCSSILSVCVDANCRLIAQLEVEPYMVSLRNLLPAVCSTGLQEGEIIALLRSVVSKTAVMHNASFVHGALHAGNVLLSSYDGDTVLTQPCGLMSQSSMLPSDLSVLSVARACSIAPHLQQVWGAHQLHVKTQTSTRLGTPPRPDINELITYHNLAVLGWERDERDTEENVHASGEKSVPYTPTTADDLYALGLMAFLLYVGVPAFHMASLWAAVERLGVLAADYAAAVASSSRHEARRIIAAFCFGEHHMSMEDSTAAMQLPDLFTCGYGSLQRHVVSRLRPEFEQALQNFIVDCVEASCMDAIEGGTAMFQHASNSGNHNGNDDRCGPHYRTAQDLLDAHVLFQRFGLADPSEAEGDEEGRQTTAAVEEKMRDTVHRVVYPAFCTWTRVRGECGSAPHLARMHSNALYTARCTSLFESLQAATAEQPQKLAEAATINTTITTVLSTLCPEVAGDMQGWQQHFPSVDAHCGVDGSQARESKVTEAKGDAEDTFKASPPVLMQKTATAIVANRNDVSLLLKPSEEATPTWLSNEDDGRREDAVSEAAEDALATQLLQGPSQSSCCEFHYYHQLHALVLADKQSDSFHLSRAFVLSRLSYTADTLVLQHLHDCTVTLLAPFRYVVLDDVVQCEVRLGPCETCVLRNVHHCPLIAVAARYIAGAQVRDTHISWSGQGGWAPQLQESHQVSFSLYGIVYSGLVEDYKRVGLPLEHVASLHTLDDRIDDGGSQTAEHHRNDKMMRRRTFKLSATSSSVRAQGEIGLCLTPEAPYAHALLAAGSRYVHRGNLVVSAAQRTDSVQQLHWEKEEVEGDVYHFFGEVNEKDVLVCDVHGSKEGELPSGKVSRPVVFLHDVLGDVTIERCSFCTIVIAGTPGSLQVLDCHNCQLVIMARESVVERCTHVDCIMLVTEYLLVKSCDEVRVRPLFLDCPYSDEVLQRIVMGSIGGQEGEALIAAFMAGRLDQLNAVLRGVGKGVIVEDSEYVEVEDMYYFTHADSDAQDAVDSSEKCFSLFTAPYNAVSCRARREDGEVGVKHMSSSEIMAEAAQALAERLSLPVYTELLQRYQDASDTVASGEQHNAQHTVTFHDLLDCSVLRLRGALCPLCAADEDAPAQAAALSDVGIERVQFGMLYIEDAVKMLRLSHCVGPLDVVVCAATTVVMDHCTNVQLRTACVDFRATDCVGCHVALHVNNSPQYQRCTSMETSVLNITASFFDTMLAAAQVDVARNQFYAPLLLTETWEATKTAKAPTPALTAAAIHAYCTGTVAAVPDTQAAASPYTELLSFLSRADHGSSICVPPEQTPLLMALLRQPVTVVSPLPGLCVSPRGAPFLEELEAQVSRWSHRGVPACRTDVVGVALRALADVSSVYLDVPEWTAAAATTTVSANAVATAFVRTDAMVEEPAETVENEELPSVPMTTVVGFGTEHRVGTLSGASGESKVTGKGGEDKGKVCEATPDEKGKVDETDDEGEKPQQPHIAVIAVGAMARRNDTAEVEAKEMVVTMCQEDEKTGEEEEEVPFKGVIEEVQGKTVQLNALYPHKFNADTRSKKTRSAIGSAAALVVSPFSPQTKQCEDEAKAEDPPPGAVAVPAPAGTPEVNHGIAPNLYGAARAANHSSTAQQTSLGTSLNSFAAPPHCWEPLPSESPLASRAQHFATTRTTASDREGGSTNSGNTLHATTGTIPAPITGTSTSSSVEMPPTAPGPANALTTTDVGASAAIGVFSCAFPSAVISVMGPSDATDARGQRIALADGPIRICDSLSNPRQTPDEMSPIIADAIATVRDGVDDRAGRLERGNAPPLSATINSFSPEAGNDSLGSPQVGRSGSRSSSDDGNSKRVGRGGTAKSPQPLTLAPNSVARKQEVVMFSPQVSSSVSNYHQRGQQTGEDSTPRGDGLDRADLPQQATNFLHFSQDSSSRRGEYSLPPSCAAASGMSPLLSLGDYRTSGSGSLAAQLFAPEAVTAHNVDAGMRRLLQQVEEARQRFGRRQLQGVRSSEALKVRVNAAVAKLQAMKLSAEMT